MTYSPDTDEQIRDGIDALNEKLKEAITDKERRVELRDYFAAAALMVVTPTAVGADWMTVIARDAYVIADAMLAERSKNG